MHFYEVASGADFPNPQEIVISKSSDAADDPEPRDPGNADTVRWIKANDGHVLGMDMRGRSKENGPWRVSTFYREESAGYGYSSDKTPVALFDRVIDSACTAPN